MSFNLKTATVVTNPNDITPNHVVFGAPSVGSTDPILISANSLVSIGAQGTQGTTGAGSQGITGSQGATGAQGALGTQGATGAGVQGSQGATGIQGSLGTQGATGAGTQGVQGRQGTTGIQGAGGIQGTTGAGVQGITGSQGATGIQGALGTQGATGAGTQGVQGRQGTTGTQGATGAGTQGVQGIQGASVQGLAIQDAASLTPGPSVFIPAVQGLTAGKIETSQFLLVGSGGAQGATGAQGAAGAQGSSSRLSPRSGAWFGENLQTGSGAILAADRIFYVPVLVPISTTIDQIGLPMQSGGASMFAKCGIYSSTAARLPGSKIAECTSPITLDSFGFKTGGFTTNPTIAAGLYWTAILPNSGTPQPKVAINWAAFFAQNSIGDLTQYWPATTVALTQDIAYATGLPATATPVYNVDWNTPVAVLRVL